MKPSAFLTLLNCSSSMVLAPSSSYARPHEALSIRMAQARNSRPFMPTCGQVFTRRGVVVGTPDAGSVDFDECVDGVAPIGHRSTDKNAYPSQKRIFAALGRDGFPGSRLAAGQGCA